MPHSCARHKPDEQHDPTGALSSAAVFVANPRGIPLPCSNGGILSFGVSPRRKARARRVGRLSPCLYSVCQHGPPRPDDVRAWFCPGQSMPQSLEELPAVTSRRLCHVQRVPRHSGCPTSALFIDPATRQTDQHRENALQSTRGRLCRPLQDAINPLGVTAEPIPALLVQLARSESPHRHLHFLHHKAKTLCCPPLVLLPPSIAFPGASSRRCGGSKNDTRCCTNPASMPHRAIPFSHLRPRVPKYFLPDTPNNKCAVFALFSRARSEIFKVVLATSSRFELSTVPCGFFYFGFISSSGLT